MLVVVWSCCPWSKRGFEFTDNGRRKMIEWLPFVHPGSRRQLVWVRDIIDETAA